MDYGVCNVLFFQLDRLVATGAGCLQGCKLFEVVE